MRGMQPKEQTTDAVCGACAYFEGSRDPKYGYCQPLMAYERERSLHPKAQLLDVDHQCVMRSADWQSGKPAFEPKKKDTP